MAGETICDNTSVGALITCENKLLLIERARFPFFLAPPAGHIDDHGSPSEAMSTELFEEVGLEIPPEDLEQIYGPITHPNQCRRSGGTHHEWIVFAGSVASKSLRPSLDETNDAFWHDATTLHELIKPTEHRPGLEPVWQTMLADLDLL